MVRILCTLASQERIAAFMREWTANSPADRKAMADPALMMDFYRKIVPFRRGRIDGFVREQVMQATIGRPHVDFDLGDFTLLMGATDFMFDPRECVHYWRETLPGATLCVLPDAGRFVSYSHPEEVVAAVLGQLAEDGLLATGPSAAG
jgi:pimeloyl-ACP methyl ester carboxylesterase